MGFRCGIVGLPNVGKSTLFNALTASAVPAENYPFCTIDPHVGVVPVPDYRLDRINEIVQPKKLIPAAMEFVDIAGLVAGASRGEGLGNKFLAHIRETQAIAHVVRCFQDPDVAHVTGRVSPRDDIEVVNTELELADMDTLQRAIERSARVAKAGDKKAKTQQALLERVKAQIDAGQPARGVGLEEDERYLLEDLHLLTMKPTLYIANVAEAGFEGNPWLEEVQRLAEAEGSGVVAVCAQIESELAGLTDEERKEFLVDLGLDEPGLSRVIRAGYLLLGLHTFFSAQRNESRAWTIPVGTTAPQAAGKIHTDFERGFIRADVVAFDEFVTYGGEQGAKEAGKLRSEGKDYVVQDGDVIHFRFNV